MYSPFLPSKGKGGETQREKKYDRPEVQVGEREEFNKPSGKQTKKYENQRELEEDAPNSIFARASSKSFLRS